MEKISDRSLDITKSNIEKIKELFPNVVTEGKVNFGALRVILGDGIDDAKEKYQFTWNGKNESIKIAQTPSRATLRPSKEDSKSWKKTENLYIEGDNLEVLKQLQKTYYGKIKCIYIDPPYNTGGDFVYNDSYGSSMDEFKKMTNQEFASNPKTNGRFHTDWLNMIYPRLIVAKNLLRDDGVIFISIDDNEVFNLKKICDEIFGEINFVGNILWKKKTNGNNMGYLPPVHDYILCYSKNINQVYDLGYPVTEEFIMKTFSNPDNDPRGPWTTTDLSANHKGPYYSIMNPNTGEIHYPPAGRYWVFNEVETKKRIADGRIIFGKTGKGKPVQKVFAANRKFSKFRAESWWDDKGMNADATSELSKLFGKAKIFTHPKPTKLIYNLLKISTEKNDIILDFFSGSGTTASAIMKLNSEDNGNRKYIMVQLAEKCNEDSEAYKEGYLNICEIGKERIRRAGEQIKKEWMEKNNPEGLFHEENKEFPFDIGFKVFKLDSSNIKPWDSEYQYDENNIFDLADVFKEDRTKEDILYEIMLKYGIFDMPAIEIEVNGKTMFRVGKRYMIVCLEDNITKEDIQEICELAPRTVVFKESGFNNDNDKINAVYNLEKAGIEDIKCI